MLDMMSKIIDIMSNEFYFPITILFGVTSMLPRERFAWVWVTALVVVFGTYFTVVGIQQSQATPSFVARMGTLAIALGSLGIIAGVTHLIIRLGNARHEAAVPDERDHLIEWRAASVAYYVLMAGMVLVGCVMPFGNSTWNMVHMALLTIAIAEIAHHGMIVLGYRRGWHA
ncbi:MAG TPA: DUF2178 domain-containing protein [Dyella sp.]|uniref:DUF2178 domain-containing protein n=1 Tax=Dyella sp. TaxID=1869338 RepID=UPI002F91E6D4